MSLTIFMFCRFTTQARENYSLKAGFIEEGEIFKADAFKTGACLIRNLKYDLVFVDPPYTAAKK